MKTCKGCMHAIPLDDGYYCSKIGEITMYPRGITCREAVEDIGPIDHILDEYRDVIIWEDEVCRY